MPTQIEHRLIRPIIGVCFLVPMYPCAMMPIFELALGHSIVARHDNSCEALATDSNACKRPPACLARSGQKRQHLALPSGEAGPSGHRLQRGPALGSTASFLIGAPVGEQVGGMYPAPASSRARSRLLLDAIFGK